MFRKMICVLAALVLAAGMTGQAAAEETRRAEIRFTAEDGSAPADAAMRDARAKGTAAPLTEAELTAAGARILREDGVIYMIRSIRGLRTVRTAEEAAAAAWSLAELLGGGQETELEYYGRVNIGDTAVYGFVQTRNGEVLLGRMLKIAAGPDGDMHTVFSTMGFPEVSPEQIGVNADPLERKTMQAETPDVPDFERMIPGTWETETEDADGKTVKITVPVAQDPDSGLWYLADPERKIAAGSFRKMVPGEQKDCLLTSPENAGWNLDDVLIYHRIIQCRDFYARIGWNGPDGNGSPILLLFDLCTLDGEPVDNACYIGKLQNRWQTFAFRGESAFGRCLDVLAHEYSHCVTETSAPANMYMDDNGAINEALSDILGNICEMMVTGKEEAAWLVGEDLGIAIRSMSDPREYNQPAYVWDRFYAPRALTPNDSNDRGGVHINSSILNLLAFRLCREGGMTLEEALDFWMAVDFGMTTRTDYFQMAELMDWALEVTGLEKYRDTVRAMGEELRITRREQPETAEEGQMLVQLTLPDTEAMRDPYWVLVGVQIRTGEALGLLVNMLGSSRSEGGTDFEGMMEMLAASQVTSSAWKSREMIELTQKMNAVYSTGSTWRSAEEEPLTMILERGQPTIYMLMNMDPETMEPRVFHLLTGDTWTDMAFLEIPEEEADPDGEEMMEVLGAMGRMVLELLFPGNTGRKVLPGGGLENIVLSAAEK